MAHEVMTPGPANMAVNGRSLLTVLLINCTVFGE